MPVFSRQSRDAEPAGYSSVLLDRLLDGARPTDDAPAQIRELAELLAAVRAPVLMGDIKGEARAIDAFVRAWNASSRPSTPRRRRFMLATLLGSKLATAAAAGAISFGGVAAAAYTGALPEPIQDFAHETVGAPAPDERGRSGDASQQGESARSGQPGSEGAVGPDASGPAQAGLCTAFAEDVAERGKVDTNSVAYRALAQAAGGADKIEDFCADVDVPVSVDPSASQPDDVPTTMPADVPPTDAPPTPEHPTGPPIDPPAQR